MGGNASHDNPGIATDGIAKDHFLVAAFGAATNFDLRTGFQNCEILVVNFDIKSFSGFDLLNQGILVRKRGAHLFQCFDGAAVVTELEVAETDVVVGFIDL